MPIRAEDAGAHDLRSSPLSESANDLKLMRESLIGEVLQQQEHNSQQHNSQKRKRKPYTATACEMCRKRKVRCQNEGDGSSCERCKVSGMICRYETRKGRGKRKRSESQATAPQETEIAADTDAPAATGAAVVESSPRPAAMTTKHPLLRHKKRKTLKEGDYTEENDGSVDIHLSNNTQLWSEDQKHRILNSESTHSQLLSIRSRLESNHRQIEDWRKDISSKQQFIDKKNVENEKLISLYHKLEKREQGGTA